MKHAKKGALLMFTGFLVYSMVGTDIGHAATNFWSGKIEMPFDVTWEGKVLPAGKYRIAIDSPSIGSIVTIRGRDSTPLMGIVWSICTPERCHILKEAPNSNDTFMIIESNQTSHTISALYIPEKDLVVHFKEH